MTIVNNYSCPIEFPSTCEVRVNGVQVNANLKGLKKKPGTAPPPDLANYVRFTSQQNKIEMVYVNSSQPVQAKVGRFTLPTCLVLTLSQKEILSGSDAGGDHKHRTLG